VKAFNSCIVILAAVLMLGWSAASAQAYDREEYEGCRECHSARGTDHMLFVSDTWLLSGHANSWAESNGNTYCMSCHAPLQADPLATRDNNQPVPLEESEALTCAGCHLPHTLAGEVGTRLGNFIVGSGDAETGEWVPRFEGEEDELCMQCHSGSRHEKEITMWQMKEVKCIDCHMPKIPVVQFALATDTEPAPVRPTRTHEFGFPLEDDEALAAKARFSCGTEGVGCHPHESTDWAVAYIRSKLIHEGPVTAKGLLSFFDSAVAEGTIKGVGTGWQANLNVAMVRFFIQQADATLSSGNPDEAIWWFLFAYLSCDGSAWPVRDSVSGESLPEFTALIIRVMQENW